MTANIYSSNITTTEKSDYTNSPESSIINESFVNKLKKHLTTHRINDINKHFKLDNYLTTVDEILGFDFGDSTSINKIKKSIEINFSNFRFMLDLVLNEANIYKDPSFTIISDITGKLYINSDHPDKDAIEKILNEIPDIEQTYKLISTHTVMLEEGRQHMEFSKAYTINPYDAIRKFNYLFEFSYLFNKEPSAAFSIIINQNNYTAKLKTTYNGEIITNQLN